MAKLNTKTSVVDYLKSQGKDSSYSARAKLADSYGIKNYSGTAQQNTTLLKLLKTDNEPNTASGGKKTSTKNTTNTKTKTTNTSNKTTTPVAKGVDESVGKTMTSTYTPSKAVTEKDATRDSAAARVEELTSKDQIVDQQYIDALNKTYTESPAVTQANAWLLGQLAQIQSGRTSYTDQVKDMMSKIQNREKFSYDVDADPLFQQALGSAMVSGQQAMHDTIGQASALTGGYGSTYATSVGNQAYNSFIQDAYDNLPQYYNMALQAYQMEGEDMYRQLGMLSDADDREFNRNLSAYDATFNYRNQMRSEDYQAFRDSKTDAYNMANLQLSEHGQLVSDAYNWYNTASDIANTQYNREYTAWADQIAQANTIASMQNSDYWNQTNFDEGVRQYEKNFAEDVRQFDKTFTENQRQFDESLAFDREQLNWSNLWNEKDLAYKYTALNRSSSGGGGSGGSGSGRSESGDGGLNLSNPELNSAIDAYNNAGGGKPGLNAALDRLEAQGIIIPETQYDAFYNALESGAPKKSDDVADSKSGVAWENVTITKSKDTVNGIFGLGNYTGHIDTNDIYTINGKDYYAKDIEQAMEDDGVPKATRDKILKGINKLKENGSYTYKK